MWALLSIRTTVSSVVFRTETASTAGREGGLLLEAPFGLQGIPCDEPWPTLLMQASRPACGGSSQNRAKWLRWPSSIPSSRTREPHRWAMSGPVSAALHASRLAPHLSVGSLSIRRVDAMAVRALTAAATRAAGASVDGWIRSISAFRLAWHDHGIQKLEMQTDLDSPLRIRSSISASSVDSIRNASLRGAKEELDGHISTPACATSGDGDVVQDAGHDDGGRRLHRFAVA